jgi:hypothetical protein
MTNDDKKRRWAHLTPNCLPDQYPTMYEFMAAVAFCEVFKLHWGFWVFYGFMLAFKALATWGQRSSGQAMDIFESYRTPPKENDK